MIHRFVERLLPFVFVFCFPDVQPLFPMQMSKGKKLSQKTYVEDKRIKTIVIASEDNIEDEENYKTFKEKVVERTVKLDMEYRRIQQEMIEDYKTETSEYKEFLKKESPKLFQVFEESGSRNLRTFKSCLIDFERVYGLWHSLKLPTDGMGEAL